MLNILNLLNSLFCSKGLKGSRGSKGSEKRIEPLPAGRQVFNILNLLNGFLPNTRGRKVVMNVIISKKCEFMFLNADLTPNPSPE